MYGRPLGFFTLRALLTACIASAAAARGDANGTNTVSFGRDVLPILSDHCFSCHGPDEKHRKADLRLDTREGATALHEGSAAIVPGNPTQSALLARLLSTDPDEVMPPPKSQKKPTPAQIETLRRWIAAGAQWGGHWSFEKLKRPPLPVPIGAAASNPIDAFVRARLEAEHLTPSPEAPRHTLFRRLALDLTGLPPSPETAAQFLGDSSPDAWANLTESLLSSPHHGERMAMWWLDAARYSDTDGYQSDATRDNWPWRDWVVDAFNRNMPFDQFTLEQCAGDLLPNPTPQQQLATCFHRNHMANGEGGRDPEESRIDYVIDRVNTVGTLWLGLTLGCTQCHNHKFDPVSQADYYGLSAFFNSIDEDGKAGGGAKPFLSFKSPLATPAIKEADALLSARKDAETAARTAANPAFQSWLDATLPSLRKGFTAWHPILGSLESVEGSLLTQDPDGTVTASGPNPRQDDYRLAGRSPLPLLTGLKLEVLPGDSGFCGRSDSGHFILTNVKVQVRKHGTAQVREIPVSSAIADFSADPKNHKGYGRVQDILDDDPRNGWSVHGSDPATPHTALLAFSEPLRLEPDEELLFEMRQRSTAGDANLARFRLSATDQPGTAVRQLGPTPLEELTAALPENSSSVDAKLREKLLAQFLTTHSPYLPAKEALDLAKRQADEIRKASDPLKVMVLGERKEPRETHVLLRGVWDKKGQPVQPGGLPSIAPWPENLEKNRLGLARWLVAPENPLTARVAANHLWQLLFGHGLVRTPEDFGLQGERPTHPELLDWLASELIHSGWDLRHLLRLITSSATYRQSSVVTEAALARDPENRLLARAPRHRLPSWMLRDCALAASGLLNARIGGPPVRPYQPDGVWEEIFMGRFHYEPSQGPAQYRRTLYAFWRRSAAPTFLFDSAQRRVCEVRTPRTNTPLQALTLLNDETQLEAARVLAQQTVAASASTTTRIRSLYKRVLLRDPSDAELQTAERLHTSAIAHYQQHPDHARQLLSRGQSPLPKSLPHHELAAQMLTASMILNLDETLTHE